MHLNVITKSSKQWPLFITLIFPLLVILLGMFITTHNYGKLYLSLITASGGLGGILSATRFPYLNVPHVERPNRYVIGFLTDVMAGIAGAYIVFLILPDRMFLPPIDKGDPYIETKELLVHIRLIGLSIVGGYLGRALLEKVGEDVFSTVKRIEANVEQVEKRIQERFTIESYLSELFYIPKASEDVNVINRFFELLKLADTQTRKYVFYRTQSQRFELSLELDHIYKKSIENPENNILKQRKSYLIVIQNRLVAFREIYRCLIESFTGSADDTTEPHDLYHKEFAYSMKDALVAKVFLNTNADISSSMWSNSWHTVQYHLKSSRPLLRNSPGVKSAWAEFCMNDAICEIMLDGNFLRDKESPPDIANRINSLLLEAVKAHDRDDDGFQFYPVREWRQLNPI